ncbi:DUF2500 domain-containing protein [Ornithinimicrobium sufpigmenti]|nr:DUF2500 domain-containing protein [Ornithinimicrobium sp. HY008]
MVETIPWEDGLPGPVGVAPFGAVDHAFSGITSMIGLIAFAVVVVVVLRLLRAGRQLVQNVNEVERTLPARVVGKRTHTQGGGDSSVTTTYYATFELDGGDRLELTVRHHQYGQLVEGDQGRLTHQGTWFRGFERTRMTPLQGPWEAPGGPTLLPPPPPH